MVLQANNTASFATGGGARRAKPVLTGRRGGSRPRYSNPVVPLSRKVYLVAEGEGTKMRIVQENKDWVDFANDPGCPT
jgi:hypothetical protein